MSVRNVFQVSALSLVMLASSAWAQSAEDEAELVEKVAVRNRLFNVEKRWEVGGNVGFTLLPRLTDHYNLNVSVGYNVAEWLGLELRAGYAISRQTSLADQVKQAFLTQMNLPRINDFSDLWQMTANGVVGVHLCATQFDASAIQSVEKKDQKQIRPAAWTLMIEFGAQVRDAGADHPLVSGSLLQGLDVGSVQSNLFHLQYQVLGVELKRPGA